MSGILYARGGKLVHLLCDFLAATPTRQESWDTSLRSLLVEVFMLGELHNRYIAFYLICLSYIFDLNLLIIVLTPLTLLQ